MKHKIKYFKWFSFIQKLKRHERKACELFNSNVYRNITLQ